MSVSPACREAGCRHRLERRGLLLSSKAVLVGMLVDVILCPCGPRKAQQSVMGVVKLIKETLLGEAVGTTVREGTLLPASLECCPPRVQPSPKPRKPGPPASEELNGHTRCCECLYQLPGVFRYVPPMPLRDGGPYSTCFANACQDAGAVPRDESLDGGGRMMAGVSSFYRK